MTDANTPIAATLGRIISRLDTLLDVEMRILEQAQYDVLPDITAEKNYLHGELQHVLNANAAGGNLLMLLGTQSGVARIENLQEKLQRNNRHLSAKRDACMKRIRAGWMATRPEVSTGYDRDASLKEDFTQVLLNMKL